MRISVIMPAHQPTSFLGLAIDSVLRQLSTGDELLVVANGKKCDQVVRFVSNEYEDNRIKVIAYEKHGISNALNFGIREARNELILRMDSDDQMLENRIALQREWFTQNLEGVLLGTQINFVCTHGKKIGGSNFTKHPLSHRRGISSSVQIAHPSVAFRKKAFLDAGWYREQYEPAEDLDLWLRMVDLGTVENLEVPLTNYRIHNEQISKRILREVPRAVRKTLIDHVRNQHHPLRLRHHLNILYMHLRVNFISVGIARLITESGSLKGALMNLNQKKCVCGDPL